MYFSRSKFGSDASRITVQGSVSTKPLTDTLKHLQIGRIRPMLTRDADDIAFSHELTTVFRWWRCLPLILCLCVLNQLLLVLVIML